MLPISPDMLLTLGGLLISETLKQEKVSLNERNAICFQDNCVRASFDVGLDPSRVTV